MKSFLGGVILMITVVGVILTMTYHTSVNAELSFEPRDSHEEYINTRRSYRPRRTPGPPVLPTEQELNLQDDDSAEEVAP